MVHCLIPSTGLRLYDIILTYIQYATLIWPMLLLIKYPLIRSGKLFPVFLFWCIAFISTLINGTNISALLIMAFSSLTVCLLTVHLLILEGFQGFRKISWLFALLMLAEFMSGLIGGLTSIIDGNGIRVINFFLGQQPASNRIYLTAITLMCLLFLSGKRIDRWVSIAGILAGSFFMFQWEVSTGKMSLYVFISVLIVARFIRKRQIWRNVLIILATFAVVFNLSLGAVGDFSWLFVGILNEDTTLNGRTMLWQSAISQMQSWHWLLGNGYGHQFMFSIGNWKVATAHSQYLNILFCFGFLGLGGYFYMIYCQIKSIWSVHAPKIKRVLLASSVTVLLIGIPTTTYQSVYIYLLFTVLVNLEKALQDAPHIV